MSHLQKVFNYRDHPIRTVLRGEEMWFVANDVCEILEIKNSNDALIRLDKEERATSVLPTQFGNKEMNLINEAGLYSLIFTSRKKEAKIFKKWVTNEVLPTIRKHGAFMTDAVLEKTLHDPDYLIGLITGLKNEKTKRIVAERKINLLTHVRKTYTATEMAKELGFKSAFQLNNDLQTKKIQFKQNGTWVFYSQFSDIGYVDIKQEVLDNGKIIYHRKFTQMGREFLLQLYE